VNTKCQNAEPRIAGVMVLPRGEVDKTPAAYPEGPGFRFQP
jgi:hypothetical protein